MTHLQALEKSLTAIGPMMSNQHLGVAELARTLAAQMDAAGADPSTRLAAAYLSVLKDIRRIGETTQKTGSGGKLAELRKRGNAPVRKAS